MSFNKNAVDFSPVMGSLINLLKTVSGVDPLIVLAKMEFES